MTPEGVLDLAQDGLATISAAAQRAWRDQLWAEEARAADASTRALREQMEPYLGFYADVFRRLGPAEASRRFVRALDWIDDGPGANTDGRCGYRLRRRVGRRGYSGIGS